METLTHLIHALIAHRRLLEASLVTDIGLSLSLSRFSAEQFPGQEAGN